MRLQQLKIDYEAEQDRLLMLLSTSEGVELRLAMTRRYVKLLWPLLLRLAEQTSARIRTQPDPQARQALLGLEHEDAVSKADFSRPYEAPAGEAPPGAEPILLARMRAGHDASGHPVVSLHPAQGSGVILTVDRVLLHSLCRLLQAAVRKSDWDMELELPGVAASSPERVLRTLN
jgi:hypothetical protein